MTNPQRPRPRRPFRRAVVRRRVAWASCLLLSAVIVAISPPLARGEAPACRAPKGAFLQYQAAEPPRPATTAAFLDGDGNSRSLADFRGQPVVLNLWATWCAPCVKEMPMLDRLHRRLAADGIRVLALSEDRGGAALVKNFYAVNGIKNLEVLIDAGGKVLAAMNVRGLPTTVLIDADGREVGRALGAADWESDAVLTFLRRCLAPAPKKKST